MAANDWLMQFLSGVGYACGPAPYSETTALGAAMFAGLADGAHASLDDMAASWQQDCQFTPAMADDKRRLIKAGWSDDHEASRLTEQDSLILAGLQTSQAQSRHCR